MIPIPRRLLVSVAAFAVAALVFGYALFRAITIEPAAAAPLPAPMTVAGETSDAAAAPSVEEPTKPTSGPSKAASVEEPVEETKPIALRDLMMAVEADPFRPERERVPSRYRMPGEEPEIEEPPPPAPPPPSFRVIGTLVTPTGGVAVVQTDAGNRVVGVGDAIPGSGYRVEAITANGATVHGMGRSVTLPVQTAMAPGRSGRGGARPAPAPNNTAREQAMRQAQLQEAMQRLREMGDSPQVQQLMRELQRNFEMMMREVAPPPPGRGGAAGAVRFELQNVEVPIRPGVIIRRPDTLMVPEAPRGRNQ